jgi:hypothetical protein
MAKDKNKRIDINKNKRESCCREGVLTTDKRENGLEKYSTKLVLRWKVTN